MEEKASERERDDEKLMQNVIIFNTMHKAYMCSKENESLIREAKKASQRTAELIRILAANGKLHAIWSSSH